MNKQTETYTVPRNFALLDELDAAQKGLHQNISYGLMDDSDINLENWKAMVIDKDGNFHNLQLFCGKYYPQDAPVVQLIHSDNKALGTMFDDGLMKKKDLQKFWNGREKGLGYFLTRILNYINKER